MTALGITGDEDLLRLLDEHEPGEQVTFTFDIVTFAGAHKAPQRIAEKARQLGAVVSHDTAGGWWRRVHSFRVKTTVGSAIELVHYRRVALYGLEVRRDM